MIADEPTDHAAEQENYFVSMSDMMVGVLFIFIILMMYYALQIKNTREELLGANETRARILQQMKTSLQNKGVPVTIDTQNGVLRLPDAILFDSARADIKPDGVKAMGHLASTLSEVLPCYTDTSQPNWKRPGSCPASPHRIDSLYIEGHTDNVRLAPTLQFQDNWDLSVKRATNTYRALISQAPQLQSLCAKTLVDCEPVLSVSGYADQRPVPDNSGTEEDRKRRNRRIELRILMVTPDAGEARQAINARSEHK